MTTTVGGVYKILPWSSLADVCWECFVCVLGFAGGGEREGGTRWGKSM